MLLSLPLTDEILLVLVLGSSFIKKKKGDKSFELREYIPSFGSFVEGKFILLSRIYYTVPALLGWRVAVACA